jgi:hypothetical protein
MIMWLKSQYFSMYNNIDEINEQREKEEEEKKEMLTYYMWRGRNAFWGFIWDVVFEPESAAAFSGPNSQRIARKTHLKVCNINYYGTKHIL